MGMNNKTPNNRKPRNTKPELGLGDVLDLIVELRTVNK